MTNKRYSKFKSEITGLFCIADENHKETFCGIDNEYICMRIVNILNQKEEQIKESEKQNKRLKYDLEHKQEHINQLTQKPLLTDILPQAYDILRINNELEEENEQLKQNKFICLDCKYCGYAEIGCLCEKQDHWEEFKNECNDFKELKY